MNFRQHLAGLSLLGYKYIILKKEKFIAAPNSEEKPAEIRIGEITYSGAQECLNTVWQFLKFSPILYTP